MPCLQKLERAVHEGQGIADLVADGRDGLLVGGQKLLQKRAVFRVFCH